MTVKEIMTSPAIVIAEDASVMHAAERMREHNIGAIPVVNSHDKLVGIVTDRDIVIRTMARGLDPKAHTVKDIMTRTVSCVNADTDVEGATQIMAIEKVRRLPVIEADQIVGFIALGDISTSRKYAFETGEALCEISEGCHKKTPKFSK